jgi:hypothetical protein
MEENQNGEEENLIPLSEFWEDKRGICGLQYPYMYSQIIHTFPKEKMVNSTPAQSLSR